MNIFEMVTQYLPLPVVAIAVLFAMIVSREIGAKLNVALRPLLLPPEPVRVNESHIVAAIMGLLLLLASFSFFLTLDRYELRRSLVVSEASVLQEAYRQTSFLDDPASLRASLSAYAEARLAYGMAGERERRAKARAAIKLQDRVWQAAMASVQPLRSGPLPGVIVAPINDAFDIAAQRNALADTRLPPRILVLLALCILVMTGILGFTTAAAGGRHRLGSFLLFGLITLMIVLILDVDRPRGGAFRVPQTPMADAVAAMKP